MSGPSSSETLTNVNTNTSTKTNKSSHWQVLASHTLLSPAVVDHEYPGSGTEEDPYRVEFIPGDERDPQNFSSLKKWSITLLVAIATLAVAFVSSAYTGGVTQIITGFRTSDEVVVLGVSLFVLGVCGRSTIFRRAYLIIHSLQ